ncbi:MAG: dacB [Flavisolibacter sp.]|nr:dacB [Flavisolibacter sp.]
MLAAVTIVNLLFAQTISTKLTTAFTAFENDSQLKSAITSLYVVDAATGTVLFERNAAMGLAPASTQKIITSATAYEVLGKDFRYKTEFSYSANFKTDKQGGNVFIKASGDPTLGSWRWKYTSEDSVLKRVTTAMAKTGVKNYAGFVLNAKGWEGETIPGGWMWDDIGNYYGAGADALNWRENQYDLIMRSGKNIGDPVSIVGTRPTIYNYSFISNVTSAAKGSGDNSYIYFPITSSSAVVRGTIPVNEERFTISGAMPSARDQFLATLADTLSGRRITGKNAHVTVDKFSKIKTPDSTLVFHTEISPPLDSISYWFLKRSINLYGEALAKTIAWKGGKTATTENGVNIMRNFWKIKNIGIDGTELNIEDGSGLSPLNRVTTHALVSILRYAKKQPWFESYLNGFPEFNGMKLKSGTISGVKSFCGYHTAKDGVSYIVSFIVNNYNGASSSLVQKMYKVLDVLK